MVLNVPSNSTFSGITFVAPFPSILPKATTVGIVFSTAVLGFMNWLFTATKISEAISNGLI